MHPLRRLLSETALYGLSSVVGRILNYLLLVPFHTSILSPSEYGIVTEWYAYIAFFQIIYTYGIETAYFRFAKETPQAFNVAISTLLLSTTLFSGCLVLGATPIAQIINHTGQEIQVYYVAAILATDTMLCIPFAYLRLQNRSLLFASTKLAQIGMAVALNIILLYGCPQICSGQWMAFLKPWIARWYDPTQHVTYILLANLLANTIAIPILTLSTPRIQPQYSWKQLRPMLIYALPLLLTSFAATTNDMLSRIMLRHWLPPHLFPGQSNEAILGIFGACYKLSIFMSLAAQAFRYAADPFFFKHAKESHAPQLFSTVMHGYVLVTCFILFAVSINLSLISTLLLGNPAYTTALSIVPYLLLAHLLLGIYYNLSVWFRLSDKTFYSAITAGLGALVTIVLNRLLIPHIGYWGSVWATIASYTSMNLLCYYWGQYHYPIPYQIGREARYIIGTILGIWCTQLIPYTDKYQAIAGNLALTLLSGILVLYLSRKTYLDYEQSIRHN